MEEIETQLLLCAAGLWIHSGWTNSSSSRAFLPGQKETTAVYWTFAFLSEIQRQRHSTHNFLSTSHLSPLLRRNVQLTSGMSLRRLKNVCYLEKLKLYLFCAGFLSEQEVPGKQQSNVYSFVFNVRCSQIMRCRWYWSCPANVNLR